MCLRCVTYFRIPGMRHAGELLSQRAGMRHATESKYEIYLRRTHKKRGASPSRGKHLFFEGGVKLGKRSSSSCRSACTVRKCCIPIVRRG